LNDELRQEAGKKDGFRQADETAADVRRRRRHRSPTAAAAAARPLLI